MLSPFQNGIIVYTARATAKQYSKNWTRFIIFEEYWGKKNGPNAFNSRNYDSVESFVENEVSLA